MFPRVLAEERAGGVASKEEVVAVEGACWEEEVEEGGGGRVEVVEVEVLSASWWRREMATGTGPEEAGGGRLAEVEDMVGMKGKMVDGRKEGGGQGGRERERKARSGGGLS